MSVNYSNTIGLPWVEYLKVNAQLQTQTAVKEVAYNIESSSRQQIATMQQISDAQLLSVHENTQAVREGTEILGMKLDAIDQSIGKLQATFEWGINQITMELGHLNDSIQELISIAKTPSQTWAYEQYEIARDNVRRNLYEESIEPLNRAIHGYGDNTGYAVDYRFHYLHGVIRLGNYHNYSDKIVNPRLAYEAFRKAAKYAEYDDPKEAALACLSAGWAAYVLGDIEAARIETRKSIELDARQAESYFQLAKIEASDEDMQSAIKPLASAIKEDVYYSIKASSDDSFKPYLKEVNKTIEKVKNDMSGPADRAIEIMKEHCKAMIKSRDEILAILSSSGLGELKNRVDDAGVNELKRLLRKAEEERDTNTLFGMKKVVSILAEFFVKESELKQTLVPEENEISTIAENKKYKTDDLFWILLLFTLVPAFMVAMSYISEFSRYGIIEAVFWGVLGAVFILLPVGFAGMVVGAIIVSILEAIMKHKNRNLDKIIDHAKKQLEAVEYPGFDKLDEGRAYAYFGYNYSAMDEEDKYRLGMLITGD